MKITNEKEIKKLVDATTKAYLKYKDASGKVSAMIEPLLKKAKTQEDITQLLNLTSPVDKNGKYTAGDYIGRMGYIMQEKKLKQKLKNLKKPNNHGKFIIKNIR
jgi:hypothetical protein